MANSATAKALGPLTPILTPNDTIAMAQAAALLSFAEQADRNAGHYTGHPADHGGFGSASKAFRVMATSMRWEAQRLLLEAEQATTVTAKPVA